MKRTTDNKQNLMKLTRYNKKRFSGCEVILNLTHNEQMMILDLVFHNELFNKTTNPLFSKHYECIENDEKYKEKVRENLA